MAIDYGNLNPGPKPSKKDLEEYAARKAEIDKTRPPKNARIDAELDGLSPGMRAMGVSYMRVKSSFQRGRTGRDE